MNEKLLIINAGSSSIKFQVLNKNDLSVVARGLCERIKIDGNFIIDFNNKKTEIKQNFPDFQVTLEFVLKYLIDNHIINDISEIVGVGNRIVHGGVEFKEPIILDQDTINKIDKYSKLAPLHNPPELKAASILIQLFPNTVHIGVFDTGFHQDIPKENYMYAIKKEWLDKYNVRRFGFHGISYAYINDKMEKILNKKNLNLIVCHLGNGSSMCSIKNGKSISTSMGFSALDGLIMGTRCGDISPSVVHYMMDELNASENDVYNMLMKESGLLGLTGYSDMRNIIEHINENDVNDGFKLYAKRLINYISIAFNDLENKVDAIVFTGGIGENTAFLRSYIANNLYLANIKIDDEINNQDYKDYKLISTNSSEIPVYCVRTNEELMIAIELCKFIK